MKHLIVYTHPNPMSFNHAILTTVVEELQERHQDIRVRDLYALGFDPVIRQSDYEAIARGEVSEDIRVEQGHILWADIIIFIFPIFWAGLPSLLKGYIERVYSQGFAYEFTDKGMRGLLPGKKVVVINTTGGSLKQYESSGMLESIKQTIDGGIFRFCSMEVVSHRFFMNVPFATELQRTAMLDEVQGIIQNLIASGGDRAD
jgi:NAD(P)H dehydrogenase (quinone)